MYRDEFTHDGITYIVKLNADGKGYYRVKHSGQANWMHCGNTIGNTRVPLAFRLALAKVRQRLEDRAETWNAEGKM